MAQVLENPGSLVASIAAHPSQIIQSSASLPWKGFLVEKYLSTPGERPPGMIANVAINMLCKKPARIEFCGSSGRLVTCLKPPGSVTIFPVGSVPAMRLHTPSEFVYCALEQGFVQIVQEEMDHPPISPPVYRPCLRDAPTQRLLRLLLEEMDEGAPTGYLYAESLAYALTLRYLHGENEPRSRHIPRTSALPTRIFKRVQERMESGLHLDLSLGIIAAECGYSRTHFLRMFQASIGMTPHQYLLKLRMDHARKLLKDRNVNLIDIASACGFSSQSHMTTVFRRHFGVTPAGYRRNL
jgi:AraC family transcriptional regulator